MPDTFTDIFALFKYLNVPMRNGRILHTASHFEVMELGNDEVCAVPMPMQPLYRGQNTYYDTCKPSLYRRQWTPEELFERDIQLADFKYILNEHPEIKERLNAGIKINYEGLAQHYGIPTDILDFTNSPLVAAFFATTTYNPSTDTYAPILHTVSKGVIYVNLLGGMFESMMPGSFWAKPIGMEVLHRPGEQRAYGRKMRIDEDLNAMGDYQKYFFWHSPDASLRVWQNCNGPMGFFPYDPMTEKARNISKYRIYSLEALDYAYSQNPTFASDIAHARDKMEERGCHFVNYHPFAYTQDELNFIKNELNRLFLNG